MQLEVAVGGERVQVIDAIEVRPVVDRGDERERIEGDLGQVVQAPRHALERGRVDLRDDRVRILDAQLGELAGQGPCQASGELVHAEMHGPDLGRHSRGSRKHC